MRFRVEYEYVQRLTAEIEAESEEELRENWLDLVVEAEDAGDGVEIDGSYGSLVEVTLS